MQKKSYAQAQKESMYDVTKSPLSMESKGFFAREGMRTPPVTEVYRMMGAHQGLPETSYKLAKTLDFKSAKQKDLNDLLEQIVMEEGGNVGYSNIPKAQEGIWTTSSLDSAPTVNSTTVSNKEIDRIDRINKLAAQVIKKNPKDYTNEDLQILSESTIKDANKYIDRYKIERANAARKEGWSSPQKFAEATSAIGSRLSLQNTPVVGEYVPEILDVTRGIGEMASGLGRVPQNIQEGNYGQAALDVLTPTALGALAGVGSATTRQFVNNLVNPLAGTKELLTPRNINFSIYPSQVESVAARAQRLISQKNKKGWNEQLTPDLEDRLSKAVERHIIDGDYPGSSLGANLSGRTSTIVSKEANIKGIPLTEPQKSMIAAHETGHYYSNSLKEGEDWAKYFDFSDTPGRTYNYFRGKPYRGNAYNELRERAAQLKDYIAYKNNIPLNKDFNITRAQLDDALENYVKDTGLDNSMTPFIEALKKKGNISGFLKEMNKRPLILVPAAAAVATTMQQDDLILNRQQGGNVTSAINEIENLQKIQNNMYNNNQRISRLAMMLGGGLIRGYQEGGIQQPMSPEEEQMMMEQAMQQEMAMQQGQQQPMPQQGGGMEEQPQQPQPQPGENKYMQLPPEQQVEVYKQIIDFVMENGIDTLEQQYPEEYEFFEEFGDMLEGEEMEGEEEEMGGEMETEAGRMEMGGGEEMESEYPTDEEEVPVGARPGENAMRPAQPMEGAEQMKEGGIPQRYRNMGFTKVGQKRQSDRPGKKWQVLAKKGDKYKVVHGGAKGMEDFKQHGNKDRQKRFWDRMGGKDSAKANDPFSPLYWHKRFGTW